jgi:hypothetical protein
VFLVLLNLSPGEVLGFHRQRSESPP